ncbi:oxysterol-binding protein-related protein 7 isoform X2 [Brachyhypopomus gauderio]|uniref:oxysterol-binding protein-related protein 7 isoform X2 n=1 Tax=Brachyhypopomus gauderio TaxID=698409 RepID=UPI004041EB94
MDDLQMDAGPSKKPNQHTSSPGVCEGYLMKRRKWPLKGWHKRYFVLDKGILRYSKNQYDNLKGKLHGSLDVSLAVMSVNRKARRIDLDTGHILYHIMAKSHDLFYMWVTKLSLHRMYKRNEVALLHNGILQALSRDTNTTQRKNSMQEVSVSGSSLDDVAAASAELTSPRPAPSVDTVSAWLQQAQDPDHCTQELNRCQTDLSDLKLLVQKLHSLDSDQDTKERLQRVISMQNLSLEKPKKKYGKVWGHNRTICRDSLGMLAPPASSSPEGQKLFHEICTMSQRLHISLSSVHKALSHEHHRLQEGWTSGELLQNTSVQINNLCTTLNELDMRSRQTRIHSRSECSDSSEESFHTVTLRKSLRSSSARTPSVADSTAEYFDACDNCAEASDESGLSDASSVSEPDEDHAMATLKYRASLSKASVRSVRVQRSTHHRTDLPATCPDNSHVGLISILYNNIGKDLSHVSMPVALNEPVNLLQRLCEELEYSELLDTANRTEDPYQRMVYIAAFAISGYATAQYRNRYKPFNPVLGETFECIREDRGFRYISEQVSHHPPVSACHAVSHDFCFWQDQRWRNRFWGKSLEIRPTGMVNVTLPRYGDHYEWNKVVTCIHNVLSQQRHLEHYGEVNIHNLKTSVCSCKITFVKSRYWGSDANKNEVQGQVLDQSGNIVHRFGGFWHEGIFCDTLPNPQCVWKPHPQPKDYILYYGFSTFAMEMNELTPDLIPLLPLTDTRLRPDQRLLEEGKVEEADKKKDEVEQKQRDRRKLLTKKGEEHIPRFFRKSVDGAGREVWLSNGSYWDLRENPGFSKVKTLELW